MVWTDEYTSSQAFWVAQAEAHIAEQNGVLVSVEQAKRNLVKFGAVSLADTDPQTVATLGASQDHETIVNTNAIDKVSSSSGSDTMQLTVQGHTISGGDFTAVTQTVTLAGQTETALTTAMARVNRAYVSSGTASNAGTIYIYEDDTVVSGVPQTATQVHATIGIGRNQTEKTATTTASDEYLLITQLRGSVNKKTSAVVEFEFQIADSATLASGDLVWRPQYTWAAATDGSPTASVMFQEPLIVPANYDCRIIAEASAGTTPVSASFHGVYASVLGNA